jgi:hypothetical protein
MLLPPQALKVEKQLAANGIDHCAAMAERKTGSRAHHARLAQWVAHAGDGFHRQDGVADGRGRHFVLAQ